MAPTKSQDKLVCGVFFNKVEKEIEFMLVILEKSHRQFHGDSVLVKFFVDARHISLIERQFGH